MIYQVWSGKMTPGLDSEPWKFAEKIAKLSREINPHANEELLNNFTGSMDCVHWVSKHESLSAMQEANKKFFESEGWKSLRDEMQKARKEIGTVFFTDMERSLYNIADL